MFIFGFGLDLDLDLVVFGLALVLVVFFIFFVGRILVFITFFLILIGFGFTLFFALRSRARNALCIKSSILFAVFFGSLKSSTITGILVLVFLAILALIPTFLRLTVFVLTIFRDFTGFDIGDGSNTFFTELFFFLIVKFGMLVSFDVCSSFGTISKETIRLRTCRTSSCTGRSTV